MQPCVYCVSVYQNVEKLIQSNASTVDAGTVDFRNQGLNLFFDKKFLTTGSALNVPGFETFMDIKT